MLEISTLNTLNDIDEFFDSRSSGRICFLVGAGISFGSGVPGASAILQQLIDSLPIPDAYRKELAMSLSEDWERAAGVYDCLRFEQVMSALELSLDPDLSILSGLSVAARPNDNHYRLARLIGRGHFVVTTNFDDLIEQACRELGIHVHVVVTDEDFQEFSSDPKLVSVLFKIHGTVENGGIKHRVAATFEDVTGEPVVSADKWQTVSTILGSSDLVVLGYSGSDDFDVIPALFCGSSPFNVYWIQHDDGAHEFPYRLKWTIGRQFLSSGLGEYTQRTVERFHMATANTSIVLDVLVRGWIPPIISELPDADRIRPPDLRHRLASLFTSSTLAQQYFLSGVMFYYCGDIPMAHACFEKARGLAPSKEGRWLALVSAYEAIAWAERWEMASARASARACLEQVKVMKVISHRFASMLFMGFCCGEEYEAAKYMAKRVRFPSKIMRRRFNRWTKLTLLSQTLLNYAASEFEPDLINGLREERDSSALEIYEAFLRELSVSEIASSRHPLAPIQRQLHGDADLFKVFLKAASRHSMTDENLDDSRLALCQEIYERVGARCRLAFSTLLHGYSYRFSGWSDSAYQCGAFARLVFAKIGNRYGCLMATQLMHQCQSPARNQGGEVTERADEILDRSFNMLLRPPMDGNW